MKNSILGKARWLREAALVSSNQTSARLAREAIEAHRRVSGGQSRSKCAAQVRRANIELLKAEWLKYATVILFLFTVGIGQMWGADYALYTSSTITAGDYIIVGQKTSDSKYYAMNNTCTNNQYMGIEQVTVSNNKITTTATNIVWTISSTTDGYYIKNGNKFLNDNATSSKNYAQTVSTASGTCVWSFSYANSKWSITNEGTTTTKNKLSFNMGNPRVACYASLQSGANQIYLYKKITLSSIAVKTAPTKVSYTEGEYFDPTGLVITLTYSDNSTEDVSYAGHTSDFTFSPTTSTALTTSNTSVSITYGGKSTSQAITVAASGCDKSVALATGSPSHGTISFSQAGPLETCDGSVNVTMTITPDAGYYLSAYSSSGVSTSNTPSITTGTSATTAQTPTLTFAQEADGTYTAGATFTALIDHFIDNIQGTSGFTGEGKAKSGNYSATLAELTLSDGDKTTGSSCRKEHYHFVGWVTAATRTSKSGGPYVAGDLETITGTATGTTYYAVWAMEDDE